MTENMVHIATPPPINSEIIRLLRSLLSLDNDNIDKSLRKTNDSIVLYSGSQAIISVTEHAITLLGDKDLSQQLQIHSTKKFNSIVGTTQLAAFIADIKPSITMVNHLGISYACPDIEKEVGTYMAIVHKSDVNMYEEPSGFARERWFFIGDHTNERNSLFEIVLRQSASPKPDYWIPHFQVDIDTSLSIEELRHLAEKHLGKNFFGWELDIKNYGVVLAMGRLSDLYGVKLYLGLGTQLRDNKWHREHGLIKISG